MDAPAEAGDPALSSTRKEVPQKSSPEEKNISTKGDAGDAGGKAADGSSSEVTKMESVDPEKSDSDAVNSIEESKGGALSLGRLGAAVEEIDDNIDDAIGNAADSIWSFATSMTGKVKQVVKEGDFENLRKNVTSHLPPLDYIGKDLTTQMGAFAPNEESIANFTGSVKSVAATVQRNAQAMEAAILAKANMVESEGNAAEGDGRASLQVDGPAALAVSDPAIGLLPLTADRGNAQEEEDAIDVNEEIAKVGETITNSFVGQTVGGLWTGLWGQASGQDQGDTVDAHADVPKTRFEKRIFELEANPDTYCEPAKDLDGFEEWGKSFVLDVYADRCIAILDRHESIAELYERVVPKIVEEDTFWMRYFFARHVLEKEEERRKKLLERAENTLAEGDDEDGWGDDDWDDAEVQTDDIVTSMGESDKRDESGAPSFTGDQESPQQVKIERPLSKTGPQNEVPTTKTSASKATPSKPAANLEVISTPEDGWGDDDWE